MQPAILLLLGYLYSVAAYGPYLESCIQNSLLYPNATKTYECKTRPEKLGATWEDSSTLLSSCVFIGCGTLTFKSNVTLRNVVFRDSDTVASALRLQGKTALLENVVFDNCTARNGGALMITQGAVTIINSTFTNNKASTPGIGCGGAIWMNGNTPCLTISYSQFHNNTAMLRGGSIYIENSATLLLEQVEFTGGRAIESRGMDIYAVSSSVNWKGGRSTGLLGIQVQGPSGGSLALEGSSAVIENVVFEKHWVSWYGGALYAISRSQVVLKNITVSETYAERFGGAIYNLDSNVTCIDCRFRHTGAGTRGGAIFCSLASLNLTRTVIEQSWVMRGGYGSAIMAYPNSNTIIEHSRIHSCYYHGGGRSSTIDWATVFSFGYLEMRQSQIANCSATLGTAINVYLAQVNLTDVTFENNFAYGFGGTVSLNNAISTLSNVRFINNTGWILSAGLALVTDSIKIYPTTFFGKIEFINNTLLSEKGLGGALYMEGGPILSINTSDLVITGNKAFMGEALYSDVHYVGDSLGLLEYNPPMDHIEKGIVPVIEGSFYFYREPHANFIAGTGVLNRLLPSMDLADSRPVGAICVNATWASTINGSALGNDYVIPTIQVVPSNAFGRPVKKVFGLGILAMSVETTNGSVLMTVYKSLMPGRPYTISFRNIVVSPLRFNDAFDGVLKVSFYCLHQQDYTSSQGKFSNTQNSQILYFTVPKCETSLNSLVISHFQSNGKPVYVCVPKYQTSDGLKLGVLILALSSIVLAFLMGVFAHKYRHYAIYRSFSSIFMSVITLGCILQLTALVVQSSIKHYCMLFEWFELVGLSMVLLSILFKTHRIKLIFIDTLKLLGSSGNRITNKQLFYRILVCMVVVVVFLVAWQTQSPLLSTSKLIGGRSGWMHLDRCESNMNPNIFSILSIILHVQLVCGTTYFAFVCRNVPSVYNETKTILIMTYAWLMCTGILYPLSEFLVVHPDILLVLKTCRIWLPVATTLGWIHIPRIYLVLTDPEKAQEGWARTVTTVTTESVFQQESWNQDMNSHINPLTDTIELCSAPYSSVIRRVKLNG